MAHEDHQMHGLHKVVTTTMANILGMNTHMNHRANMDHGAHMDHSGHMDTHMDHGGHDSTTMGSHEGMNHEGMGHGMDHGSSGHSMMKMWFHGGYEETVLFESWYISTLGGLIGSMVGIFFMAALYEGLKYYREYLFWKTYNALQYRSVAMPAEKSVVSDDNQIVHMVGEVIHKQPPTMFSWMHGFQTLLHIIQMVLSYFLMLIFMTYNTWLCLAVVLGAAVGYFLFGWKKSVIVDVTEHCH